MISQLCMPYKSIKNNRMSVVMSWVSLGANAMQNCPCPSSSVMVKACMPLSKWPFGLSMLQRNGLKEISLPTFFGQFSPVAEDASEKDGLEEVFQIMSLLTLFGQFCQKNVAVVNQTPHVHSAEISFTSCFSQFTSGCVASLDFCTRTKLSACSTSFGLRYISKSMCKL